MTRHHRLPSALLAAASVLLLSACGSGDGAPQADADDVSPSSVATAGETTVAPEGQSGSDQMADVSFEDQSGAGDRAVVDTVSSPQGGFVVVTVDEDDREGTVLGSTQLQVGTSDDVEVALDPPLTQDTDLTATLYADTDGDGEFDLDTDQFVPDPEDGDDNDGGDEDQVDDGAEYRIG